MADKIDSVSLFFSSVLVQEAFFVKSESAYLRNEDSRVATVAGAGKEPAARHGCAHDMSPRSGASRHGGRGWVS